MADYLPQITSCDTMLSDILPFLTILTFPEKFECTYKGHISQNVAAIVQKGHMFLLSMMKYRLYLVLRYHLLLWYL